MIDFLTGLLGPLFTIALLTLSLRAWLGISGKRITGPECKACGYCRVGISNETPCPECGKEQKYPGSILHIRKRKTVRSPMRIATDLLLIVLVIGVAYATIKLDDYRLNYYQGFADAIRDGDTQAVTDYLNRYPELAKGRFRYANNINDPSGPLVYATHADPQDVKAMVALLLKHGADPNASQHGSAFRFAIDTDDLKLAQILVNAGFTIDPDVDWLRLAVKHGWQNVKMVQYLLDQGMDPNHSDGIAPLQVAMNRRDNLLVMRMLLDAGADPNLPNKNGYTTLMYAVTGKRVDCVRLLLDVGADVNASHGGTTAMSIATRIANRSPEKETKAHTIVAMLDHQLRQNATEPLEDKAGP